MGILSARQHLGAAAILLAISALLSRLMGLIRDKIISWQFGAGQEADMYFAAFVVPDIINYLLAGAFMSITIIPLLAKSFQEDENDAWKFFSCIFFWMFTASSILTLSGEIWAVHLAKIIAPGFNPEQILRLAFFMRIILPAQVFFLCGSCFTALLLLRRQFTVPAITPLIYNGSIIICGLLLPFVFDDPNADFGMTGYCIGVTLGALAGAFFLPLLIAKADGLHLQFVWHHKLLKKFLFIALPLMLGQTVIMLDEQFLRVFGSMLPEGGVSLLNYARRISQVPVALMGQAIAVASYPFLAKLLAQNEYRQFEQTLHNALAAGLCLIIPCALWMIVTCVPIMGLIFQGGRFGFAETISSAPLTQIMLASTPLWIVYMVLSRAYYAYGDTLTPAITGTIITIICIPCYYFWAIKHGAWAIASVSGFGVSAYVIWLVIIWIKRKGSGSFSGLGSLSLRSVICSLPAALSCWLFLEYALNNLYFSSPFITYCIKLVASMGIFVIIFLPCTYKFAPEILKNVWKIVARKQRINNQKVKL